MLQEGRAWTQHSQANRVHLICQLSVLVNEAVQKESSILEAGTPLVLMCSMQYMKQGSHRNVSSVYLFLHQTSLAKGAHKHNEAEALPCYIEDLCSEAKKNRVLQRYFHTASGVQGNVGL